MALPLTVGLADGLVDIASHFKTFSVAHLASLGAIVVGGNMRKLTHRRTNICSPGTMLIIQYLTVSTLGTIDLSRHKAARCQRGNKHQATTTTAQERMSRHG
ncbi:hypothetical protein O4G98_10670 [Zoogloeaceae bacterium G21618-S1]|nr:hypothetical protein [Zoogloeaceae bacterium G21618-S1]